MYNFSKNLKNLKIKKVLLKFIQIVNIVMLNLIKEICKDILRNAKNSINFKNNKINSNKINRN